MESLVWIAGRFDALGLCRSSEKQGCAVKAVCSVGAWTGIGEALRWVKSVESEAGVGQGYLCVHLEDAVSHSRHRQRTYTLSVSFYLSIA